MKENWIFDRLPAKFCGMVEEYRLELAKKNGIDMQLDVSLAGNTICGIHETVLISKKFGFIQRLVRNDKIDYKKDWHNSNDTGYVYVKADTKKTDLEIKSDTLLMVLAIENEPIKFLCSILK